MLTKFSEESLAVKRQKGLPGIGAVFVENVELFRRYELAAVNSRLDGAQSTKDTHLFDIADDRNNIESLELRVDGVQTADEVLEEELEGLRQTDQLPTVDAEGRHLCPSVVDQLTSVVLWIAGNGWWRGGCARRSNASTASTSGSSEHGLFQLDWYRTCGNDRLLDVVMEADGNRTDAAGMRLMRSRRSGG